MKRRIRPRFEQLEDRLTPSSLGQPWPNPGHLTLSFANDGTLINGAPSCLVQTLNRLAPTSQWQQTVLKAVQAWVPTTNVNFSVVGDGGQPFGSDGSVQGDSRFGDIRVGMASLPANLVATTAPFSWTGSTWSGDIVLNSAYNFSLNGQGGYDLGTVIMHEAGHALGLPDNSSDPGSIMYANYTGPRTGPDSLDVRNIQTLYGARSPDANANDTLATATPIGNLPSQLGFNADLPTAGDIDYYKIQTPLLDLGLSALNIQVNAAGMSFLTPTVSVFDASGRLLSTQTAASPTSNTVTATIPNPQVLGTYYFAVSHTSADPFAVGDYSVNITYKGVLGTVLTGIVPSLIQGTVNTVNHVNSVLTSATMLTAAFGSSAADQRFSYLYQSNLVYGGDADYYKFTVPQVSASTGAYALDAMVWQAAPGGLAPALHFFDSSGKPIATQVMADSSSVFALQLLGVTPGQSLYVEVAGQTTQGPSSTGFYVLGIKFNQQPETVAPPLGSATLSTAGATDRAMLAMNQNGVFYFELGAANGGAASSSVTMTVYGPNRTVALAFTVAANAAPRTTAVYLPAGVYTIVYSLASSARTLPPTTYWVSGEVLSDPIGPYYTSPSPANSTSMSDMSTTSSSGSTTGDDNTDTISSTTTFNASGSTVTIGTGSDSSSVAIPPPGQSSTQSFTTSAGVTTVTLTTSSDGTTTLTLTTPSSNTIGDTTTTSGNTSTETLSTSDGIQVTIVAPVTTPAPTYSGAAATMDQPYYY